MSRRTQDEAGREQTPSAGGITRSVRQILRSILGVSDAVEVVVVVGLGTALFFGLTVAVPIWLAYELFQISRPFLAVTILALSGLTIGSTVRDALRRQWTSISTVVAAFWVGCVLFVFIKLA
jgi:hypothetical protein